MVQLFLLFDKYLFDIVFVQSEFSKLSFQVNHSLAYYVVAFAKSDWLIAFLQKDLLNIVKLIA